MSSLCRFFRHRKQAIARVERREQTAQTPHIMRTTCPACSCRINRSSINKQEISTVCYRDIYIYISCRNQVRFWILLVDPNDFILELFGFFIGKNLHQTSNRCTRRFLRLPQTNKELFFPTGVSWELVTQK